MLPETQDPGMHSHKRDGSKIMQAAVSRFIRGVETRYAIVEFGALSIYCGINLYK